MREVVQCIGRLPRNLSEMLCPEGQTAEIFIDEGTIRHIKRRHPYTYRTYFEKLCEVLSEPDYIGLYGLGANRVELVKKYKDIVLVALKVDDILGVFVSSMYIIEPHRIEKRIAYGKLKAVNQYNTNAKKKGKKLKSNNYMMSNIERYM